MDEQKDISIPWTAIQQYKGMKCGYMLQCGGILKTLYWVKEARLKKATYHMIPSKCSVQKR